MTTKELYTKGARIWIPHPEKVWESAEVLEDYKGKTLRIQTDDDKNVQQLSVPSDEKLPPLRNPDILIGWNDLTSLSYLHEPAVLHNLRVRFERHNSIYTYCGIVLVAINPYSELPIYSTDTIFAYRGQAMGDLDPHIFAVAEEAFTKLEREQKDQSIIVSGESGAGKTVSAKYAMRYFATVGGSTTETQVEKKVLASSPIMEAIGNAKTTRNDNSSRFGKFIEIHFSPQFHIQGASMRTYLLEKSRVVFQAPDERNYHIFYQLCASRDTFPELQLDHQDKFHYLNQGNCSMIQGVKDSEQFAETCSALSLLGFSENEQKDMWHILAAVLHLGNVLISEAVGEESEEMDSEGSAISANDPHLVAFAKLLQLDPKEMKSWLCQRRIVSLREAILKPMTVNEAVCARDALAKHIYAELFDWIVAVVNKALKTSGSQQQRNIGVLDIYGFETFEINSFEQFCINYANEKLQQQFNQHVFKLEQEEYLKEDIAWKFIDFYDNQPCIDLIETRLGILDLLDEECRMPKGSDSSWVEKLYSKCSASSHFAKPRFGNTAFIVCHFADKVTYQSSGFLEKNKDTVIEEQIKVIRNGQNKLVKKLFGDADVSNKKLPVPAGRTKISVSSKSATVPLSAQKQHKKTVGSQFRDSLNMLMSTLNATTPHYVRCIKPNDAKAQVEYNAQRVVQQLRACGVLETIRISAAGFPSRWTYMEFFQRYRVLCHSSKILRNNLRGTCEHILQNFIKEADKYQFGRTKIFFRAGQVAYLEKLRADRRRTCCIMIQKQVRAFVCRKKYLRIKRSIGLVQRYGRGLLARRHAQYLRQTAAAIMMQKHIRGWLCRVKYNRHRHLALGLQCHVRGLLARRRYHLMRLNHKATIIQRYVRGWLERRRYQLKLRHIVLVQCVVRQWLARRVLRKLKAEARSMEHIKKLNKGLENKIISLQQRIDEVTKENGVMKHLHSENVDLRSKVEALSAAEVERKKAAALVIEQQSKLDLLEKSLQQEQEEKVDIINERDRLESEKKVEIEKLNTENLTLKDKMDQLNEEIRASQTGAEKLLKERLQQEKALLEREQDQDRDAYQKLLAQYHLLESRCEMAQRELVLERRARHGPGPSGDSGGHQRTFSNASSASAQDLDMLRVASETNEEDFGYGSVRSNLSTLSSGSVNASGRPAIESIDWTGGVQGVSLETVQNAVIAPPSGSDTSPEVSTPITSGPPVEGVGLVLKLQHKVKDLEKENDKLRRRVESLEKDDSPSDDLTRARDSFRVQELEMENSKLKTNIAKLSIAAAEGSGSQELIGQFQALQREHERQREECVQLRSVLASHTQGLKNVATNNYSSHVDIINEDGELVLAFEAQKKVMRQLEKELQDEQNRHQETQRDLDHLRDDYEEQQKLISANLTRSPQNQTEAVMQHEIQRLTSENLFLQERFDTMAEQCRKLKKQMKILAKKLRDAGVLEPLTESGLTTDSNAAVLGNSTANVGSVNAAAPSATDMPEGRP